MTTHQLESREDWTVLLITGPVGAGKTTVAEAVSANLVQAQIPHALLDLDALGRFWPASPTDRFNFELVLRNLTSVSQNFREAGACCLVLAYVVENSDHRARIEAALPDSMLRIIRLQAPVETLHARLRRREAGDALAWHLHRARELDKIMARNTIGDRVIATERRLPDEIAAEILTGEPWYHRLLSQRTSATSLNGPAAG